MKTGTLTNVVFFAAGAVAGYVVARKFLEAKYERLANEEIDSVKEAFSRNYQAPVEDIVEQTPEEEDIQDDPQEARKELRAVMNELGYTVEEDGGVIMDKPYVIPPENFDELDDYDTISLWYYSDGTLADFDGNVIEDIENTVGRESLNTYGEYEDDTVFVRNDRLKTDYEIMLDHGTFSDKEAE